MAPGLLEAAEGRLSRVERFHIAFVRRTFEPGTPDVVIRWCQRQLGARWIHLATRTNLRVIGRERLPSFDPHQSYVLAANHRSYFDLYAITAQLVRAGLPNRIVFPVRSPFFYDHPLGFVVNGAMSFFAMYPPLFRDPGKAILNVASLDELAALLRRGGMFAGVHPEGTRNPGDPYQLLPPQRGVGKLLHDAQVTVVPAFVNGLTNDLLTELGRGFRRDLGPIYIVFGPPVPLADLYAEPRSPRVQRAVADRVCAAIASLGEEERACRGQQVAAS